MIKKNRLIPMTYSGTRIAQIESRLGGLMSICNSIRISITFAVTGSKQDVDEYKNTLSTKYNTCKVVAHYVDKISKGLIGVEGKRSDVVQLMAFHHKNLASE